MYDVTATVTRRLRPRACPGENHHIAATTRYAAAGGPGASAHRLRYEIALMAFDCLRGQGPGS